MTMAYIKSLALNPSGFVEDRRLRPREFDASREFWKSFQGMPGLFGEGAYRSVAS